MRKIIVAEKEYTTVNVVCGSEQTEKYAASELVKYLAKIGIVESSDGVKITLSIDSSVGRDGYRIGVCECCGISITGGNGRGVIYGVFAFLEKYAGMRFFTPTLETYGEGDIVVKEGCEHVPVFEYRMSDWVCGRDAEWAVKNGINSLLGKNIPEEMGGEIKFTGPFVHTFQFFMDSPAKNIQPCLSDPENLKKGIAYVRSLLEKNPDARIISVSQNDCTDMCKCEKCTAVYEEEGSQCGTLLRYVNAIAADIAEDYPNVKIETLAYCDTQTTPKITKPLPNVLIRLCSICCCAAHPFVDQCKPSAAKFCNDIVEWGKICDCIYIWDYVVNFAHSLTPHPNFDTLRKNMRFFADNSVKGMYPEGNYNSPETGEFAELRCYLLAKLMMNPYMGDQEYYTYMDEFLEAYYGAGWRYVKLFIDFSSMEIKKSHLDCFTFPMSVFRKDNGWGYAFPDTDCNYFAMEDTIDSWWDKAEEMAGDCLDHVKKSRFQWRYLKLEMHPDEKIGREFAEEVKERRINMTEGNPFPQNPDYSLPPHRWFE